MDHSGDDVTHPQKDKYPHSFAPEWIIPGATECPPRDKYLHYFPVHRKRLSVYRITVAPNKPFRERQSSPTKNTETYTAIHYTDGVGYPHRVPLLLMYHSGGNKASFAKQNLPDAPT